MAKAKKARRATPKPKPKKRAAASAVPRPEEGGNAVPGALLALEDGRGAAEADASVEDPLEDWPEAEGEPDRWLDERPGESVEKTPDE
jgi:hypothetical protein